MNLGKQFKDGMLTQNPVLVQVLGMCSTMAITTSFFNGIGMGVAVTIILTLSNVIISAMRKIIPDKIRIAMFIVVIAGFVTCVDLSIQAFLPDLANSLGVFIPLIVVNCIILGRAESFSYKNGVAASFFDGIFQGIGYTVVLLIMCIIRELLGAGTFGGGILGPDLKGIQIIPSQFPAGMLTLPVGGFLVLGCLIAFMRLSKFKPLEKFASIYITVIRGTPMLVQLYIVYYQLDFISYPTGTLFGVDLERALPCIIALSINSSAYVAEIIRAGIQAVDKGQMEGARSCGMTNVQAMRYVVMPQAVKNILPAIGNEFVTMVKETSIIQYLGIGDLMYNNGIVVTSTYNPLPCYYISAIIYLALNIILGKGLNIFEGRLRKSER